MVPVREERNEYAVYVSLAQQPETLDCGNSVLTTEGDVAAPGNRDDLVFPSAFSNLECALGWSIPLIS